MSTIDLSQTWPNLPYGEWRDTALTLQLWTQVVGKVRLSLTPWLHHGWHVPLYVTARGLGTSPIPADGELLEIEFDFIAHRLACRRSEEHTSELQSLMRLSYAVFCLNKNNNTISNTIQHKLIT